MLASSGFAPTPHEILLARPDFHEFVIQSRFAPFLDL
jgi:hypothetical protein